MVAIVTYLALYYRLAYASQLKSKFVIPVLNFKMANQDSQSVAQYLLDNPDFFQDYPEILAQLKLPSPTIGRAVSLQERQVEVLREKHRQIDADYAVLAANAEENREIVRKYNEWVRAVMRARDGVDLPYALADGFKTIFDLTDVALRIWGVKEAVSHTWYANGVSEDTKLFASSMLKPYCGENRDFEAASWLESKEPIQSVVLLPLRAPESKDTFGILIMGAADSKRFESDMATNFLVDMAETTSAALSFLLE